MKYFKTAQMAMMGLIAVAAAVTIGLAVTGTSDADKINSGAALPEYTIREYNDRVAVFRYNEEEPLEILEVMVESLPEYDQTALSKGVYVYSERELKARIEDFDS